MSKCLGSVKVRDDRTCWSFMTPPIKDQGVFAYGHMILSLIVVKEEA